MVEMYVLFYSLIRNKLYTGLTTCIHRVDIHNTKGHQLPFRYTGQLKNDFMLSVPCIFLVKQPQQFIQ